MSPIRNTAARFLRSTALGLAVALLAACNGIGHGNKIEKLEIIPDNAKGPAPHPTYTAYQCFNDGLSLVGIFSDGTRGNFSHRAHWRSSNPAVLRVANDDEEVVTITDGAFEKLTDKSFYTRGTLIPVAPGVATITADYLNLTTSIDVTVVAPTLSIERAPLRQTAHEAQPTYMGVNSSQRYALMANVGGRIVDVSAPGSSDPVFNTAFNPVLWKFVGGTSAFVKGDTDNQDIADDLDVAQAFNADGNVMAVLAPTTGVLNARIADATPLTIQATLASCDQPTGTATALAPQAQVRIANFANPAVTLAREANHPGHNLIVGTDELLQVTGNLDTDGNLATVEQSQDLGTQSGFDIQPKDDCVKGVCLNSNFVTSNSPVNALTTVPGASGGPGLVSACFAAYPPAATLKAAVSSTSANTIDFDATGSGSPASGVTLKSYSFDFGDGSKLIAQTTPTVSHTYAKDGTYTAKVQVLDTCNGVAVNRGAAQVVIGAAPVAGTPGATLAAHPASGTAPAAVVLTATATPTTDPGSDADANAPVTYTFSFGDGTPDVTEAGDRVAVLDEDHPETTVARATIQHVYLAPGSYTPTVTVTNRAGNKSAAIALGAPIVIGGSAATLDEGSNVLSYSAIPGVLDSIEILPATATEPALTFPGQQFQAVGHFDVGDQLVTRSVSWILRQHTDLTKDCSNDEKSTLSGTAFLSNSFLSSGRVIYSDGSDGETPTGVNAEDDADGDGSADLCVFAIPGGNFKAADEPSPVPFTVTPCLTGTGPFCTG